MSRPFDPRGPQRRPGQQPPQRPLHPSERRGPLSSAGQGANLPGDYPLPLATVAILKRAKLSEANASLLLNKLVGPWADVRQGVFEDRQRGSERRRVRFLDSCASACASQAADQVRAAIYQRWQAMLATYRAAGWEVREHIAYPAWRFVSGLGMANPLEVNLVLHRIGGFPYIPGSSIKGAVRAYAELAQGAKPAPPDALADAMDAQVAAVFGARDRQGKVLFFDALPATRPALELDVINVHYPDYYRDGTPPTDWQNPNPIVFLTVGKETSFAFAVAAREGALAELAMAWLREALQTTGLGGKTSAGYGTFASGGR